MKIHLVLDYQDNTNISKDDVVIITPFNHGVSFDCNKVIIADSSIVSLDSELRDNVIDFYNSIPSKYSTTQNVIYDRVLKPIYAVIAIIDNHLNVTKDCDIVLYGGSDYTFVTTVGGEGEGYRKNFQLNWMVNAIIYHTYCNNHHIIWENKENTALLKIKNYIRWRRQYLKVVISHLKQSLYYLGVKHKNPLFLSKYVSIIDLPLQFNNLDRLLRGTSADNIVYLAMNPLCCEVLKNKGRPFCAVPPLSFREIVSIVFRNSISRNEKKKIKIPQLGLSLTPLIREIQYCYFVYEARLRRLLAVCNNVFDKNNLKTLVTSYTVGNDIVSAHNLAKQMSLKHINFQGVTMGRILYPELELADEYFLYSKKTFDCYKKYSDSYKFYLPIFQNNRKEQHAGLILTLFLQPDSYVYDYFPYIEWLSSKNWCQYNLTIVIKPHYRQNELNTICEMVINNPSIRVADKMEDCSELINKTDIAVSMHSSVLFESMASGVLTIVYNPNGKYDNEVYNEDICFSEVNNVITQAEQTLQFVDNYSHYMSLFNKKREDFIRQNGGLSDINQVFEAV